MGLYPYILGSHSNRLTIKEIQEVAERLEIEYLGGSTQLNLTNLKMSQINGTVGELVPFYHQIVQPIIKRENTTYINAPMRNGFTIKGKPVSEKIQNQISKLYLDMKFDQFMQLCEHMAALQGTVFAKPAYDEVNQIMRVNDLYPSNKLLEVKGMDAFPGVPEQLSYSYEVNGNQYYITWTTTTLTTKMINANKTETITIEQHNFKTLPWCMLKYNISSTDILGSPDIELNSFCLARDRILHSAVARLYLADLEKLLISGMDGKEALKHIHGRMLAFPSKTDANGNVIQPTAQFISPDGSDALNLLNAYGILWKQLQDTRGHVSKPFSKGADHASAESFRLGSTELYNEQQRKRKYLESFEQDFWQLVKYYNNLYETVKIPEDTELMINYKPDPYSFNSASDEVTYFKESILLNVETPVSWIMHRNQEYTQEEAEIDYQQKQEFNDSISKQTNNFSGSK